MFCSDLRQVLIFHPGSFPSKQRARRIPVPTKDTRTGHDLGSDAGIHHWAVDQELLLRNEYLAAENRILRGKIKGRLLLGDSEKTTLAGIAHRLGRKALTDIAAAAKPDTLLRWYCELIAKKFDGSKFRKSVSRPVVDEEIEHTVVRMARENPTWEYDRIVGAMTNLGHKVSDQKVGKGFLASVQTCPTAPAVLGGSGLTGITTGYFPLTKHATPPFIDPCDISAIHR